jgi:hypothetical protein
MVPPGLAFFRQPQGMAARRKIHAAFLFDLRKEEEWRKRRIELDPATSVISTAEALVKHVGMGTCSKRPLRRSHAPCRRWAWSFSPRRLARQHGVRAPPGFRRNRERTAPALRSIIANAQGSMKGQIFRIAHWGISILWICSASSLRSKSFCAHGYPVKSGRRGVANRLRGAPAKKVSVPQKDHEYPDRQSRWPRLESNYFKRSRLEHHHFQSREMRAPAGDA